MNIRRPADNEFWWEVAEACEYATFFHSPLWHRLIERTFEQCEDRTVGAVTESGVRMVLPLLKTGEAAKGMMENLMSTYAGCYGGIIADGEVSKEDLASLYDKVQSWDVASLRVNGNPLWSEYDYPVVLPEEEVEDDFTQILQLEDKTFEDVKSGFTDGHRSGMHKGERMGVTVREADSIEDYKAYFGAYEDCLRRWENPSSEYPWVLFENGYQMAQDNPEHIRLWLAEVEDEVIAGAWFFYWNQHVDYWHAASYEEYFDYRPNNVLLPRVMEDALERGYSYYDFNPSGGHTGVARFKKHFGAKKWPLRRWTLTNKNMDIFRDLKGSLLG
ncbi:lipid II:glycine glycyltransferase FemX [Salinibacter ruber]|uniref:lipid II:glycine glycyltransferase FemX n=1 Tax=Salinibacter ruber TaxID=146919 RepID=UPI0020743D40|nr:GNAT family N-acetyltransferase [Salinibacter ruber]